MRPKIIAYYLPQFHPINENDEWWGKGFTEWTNVGKAKPLYRGHNQPRVPADLGYYDLRVPEVREQQAQLAREAGVYGFCYWHYWFGNGRQLMNEIIDEVAATGKPDFPFCLGWANESWKQKQWRFDGKGDRILMEQQYGGEADYRAHYEYVRKLITNKNYIRIGGKPFFQVYKPYASKDIPLMLKLWNKWIREDGIAEGFYFQASGDSTKKINPFIDMGYDVVTFKCGDLISQTLASFPTYVRAWHKLKRNILGIPHRLSLRDINKYISSQEEFLKNEKVMPILLPQWDHSPRSKFARPVVESAPELFREQAEIVLNMVKEKQNQIVMLQAWNEWGEGNYMEPDLTWGHGYIDALREAIEEVYG